MKLVIASDIHGSAHFCRMLCDRIKAEGINNTPVGDNEGAGLLLLLGDLLYHGPRNSLPPEYNPAAVAEMLNSLSCGILAVRGNCESEVDQMMLRFPVMTEYAALFEGGRIIYLTHGHKINEQGLTSTGKNPVLLCGHTHVPAAEEREGYLYLNPGSVSIPKEGSPHSYMTLEDGVFLWKDVSDGRSYMEYRL